MVYLGFRTNVEPPGFDRLVLEELGRRGRLVGYRRYAEDSHVALFDLTERPAGGRFDPAAIIRDARGRLGRLRGYYAGSPLVDRHEFSVSWPVSRKRLFVRRVRLQADRPRSG